MLGCVSVFALLITLLALDDRNERDVIPVYILAGQSNAVGASTSVDELPHDSPLRRPQANVLFYGPTLESRPPRWAALQVPTETKQCITGPPGSEGFGAEISLGQAILMRHPKLRRVAIIKYAVNNSNLHAEWNPADPGSHFAAMSHRVDEALAELKRAHPTATPVVAGFLWMQGESDTAPEPVAQAYEANLLGLIDAVRARFDNPHLPFVIGQINHANAWTEIVRDSQRRVAEMVPGVVLALTDDLPRSTHHNDRIHFGTDGIVRLGVRFAESLDAASRDRDH